MQYSFSTIALVAFAGFAAAQSTIPACATKCIADGVAAATTCGADDLKCQCTSANTAAIQAAAATCVIGACGDQALAVLSAAQADCAKVNSGAESSSAAPSSSAAASTTVVATTSVESTSTSIVESSPSTYVISSTTAAGSAAGNTSSVTSTSVVVVPTTAPNATVTTSQPTSTQVPANAGAQLIVGAGSLFVAGIAALAAL